MISLAIAIRKAIDEDNHVIAGRIVDHLRFKFGWNYQQILERVKKERPNVTDAQWDSLLYRADEEGC